MVHADSEGRWDRQFKGLGGPEVEEQVELGRLLHGEIARLGATENAVGEVARALGITLPRAEVFGADRYDAAFAALKKDGVGALTVTEGPRYLLHAPQVAAAALKHGLATVFPYREQVEAGGLMMYGANQIGMWRRAGHFADRILRGAKPADLPVEQPTKFDLFINGKTAKALNLTVPPALRIRVDQVIE